MHAKGDFKRIHESLTKKDGESKDLVGGFCLFDSKPSIRHGNYRVFRTLMKHLQH